MKKTSFVNSNYLRKLFGKKSIIGRNNGKFYGYERSKGDLKKIFKKGGCKIVKELSLTMSYKNVFILENLK